MENMIAELLDKEITRTLEDISTAKTGSEEAKAALLKLEKLHGQRMAELEADRSNRELVDNSYIRTLENDMKKTELDNRLKMSESELEIKRAELEQKELELEEAKRSRRWRTVLDILGIGVPIAASGWWMYNGLKFEEEGKIYSSRTAQWVSGITRMFSKKG